MEKKSERPILIVIGNNKNGGIAKRASMIANGFSVIGRKATIVVTKDNLEETFFDLRENVSIVTTNGALAEIKKCDLLKIKFRKAIRDILPKNSNKRKKLNYEISNRRNCSALKNIFKQYNNPIIITLGLEYAVKAFFAAKGIRRDVIYATKTYADGELYGLDRELVLGILPKFSCVVCQTRYTADYFQKMGIRRVKVIGNPLDVKEAQYDGERKNTIVNFCRISREKRLELLIKAFSMFYKDSPEYRVDIYGNAYYEDEKKYKEELLALAEDLQLTERVAIHEAKKNIHETVKDAAMFVSTSDFEGLSNSMIEAMALGIPCICTDCDGGGAREYIENEVNGLLIPKDNVEALTEALYKFSDRKFAQECGKKATEIRKTLDINKILSEWENVINEYCS
ncbi:MAG: glycosyltransferase [Clostridia bacterium]|nr:glycosyltransferase [Clostridia bacterium]